MEKYNLTTHQEYHCTPFIGAGETARVFAISDTHVIKSPWDKKDLLTKFKQAYEMHKLVYDAGISVPKPEGIFRFEPRLITNLYGLLNNICAYGIVMERARGIPVDQIDDETLYPRIGELINAELEKIKEKGFKPSWDSELNPFHHYYDKENDSIQIIDIDRWKLK